MMQEIREYRSLAYATGGSFESPYQTNKPGVFYGYFGCQVDKSNDAIAVMDSIVRFLPKKPERLAMVKAGLINSLSSNYPNFRSISTSIENGRDVGYTKSPRLDYYEVYKTLTFDNIVSFYEQNILNRPRTITIYGNLKKIDKNKLLPFGEFKELKMNQIRVD
jgi:predicted Zn-dependent peptidase